MKWFVVVLFLATVVSGTKEEFVTALSGAGDKLVIAEFAADWCGPCQGIEPKIKVMEEEFQQVVFLEIDVDKDSETTEAAHINRVPTFKFYKHMEEVLTIVGTDESSIRNAVMKWM